MEHTREIRKEKFETSLINTSSLNIKQLNRARARIISRGRSFTQGSQNTYHHVITTTPARYYGATVRL